MQRETPYRVETINHLMSLGFAEDQAILIERGCYNETIDTVERFGESSIIISDEFVSRYDGIKMRVLLNLKKDSTIGSDYTLNALNSGKFQYKDLGKLSSSELNPIINDDIRTEISVRSTTKIKEKSSKAYKCRKCGDYNTTYEQYQGTSGDEITRRSFKCLSCNYTWQQK